MITLEWYQVVRHPDPVRFAGNRMFLSSSGNYLAAVAPVWLIYGSISSGTSPKRPRDKVSKRDESKDRNFDLRKKLFLGPLRFGSPTGLKKIIEVTSSFI